MVVGLVREQEGFRRAHYKRMRRHLKRLNATAADLTSPAKQFLERLYSSAAIMGDDFELDSITTSIYGSSVSSSEAPGTTSVTVASKKPLAMSRVQPEPRPVFSTTAGSGVATDNVPAPASILSRSARPPSSAAANTAISPSTPTWNMQTPLPATASSIMAASGANFVSSISHPLAGEWSLTGGEGFASPMRKLQTAGTGAPLNVTRDPRSVLNNLQSELERSAKEMNAAASLTGPLSAVDRPRTKHTMARNPSTAREMLSHARASGPRAAEPTSALTFPQRGNMSTLAGHGGGVRGTRAMAVKAVSCMSMEFPV
mmetsp:Transcript_13177/g.35493  ORF Transcript_13177/g.35493 Transcript_13177/m.35493 type:complete len:315 (+) Transcript_13177:1056-2000(+)